jgi:hypothetical protein
MSCVTVLREGAIAEVLDKATGVNPLWTPPWPTIEPSTYEHAVHPEYGGGVDASLLSDHGPQPVSRHFGGRRMPRPRPLPVTVRRSALPTRQSGQTLVQRALLPLTNLRIERRIQLAGRIARVEESVENLSGVDRPGLDRARAGAVSAEGRDRVSCLSLALEGVRASLWERRLSRARGRVRGPAPRPFRCRARRRKRKSAALGAPRTRRARIRLTRWTRCGTRRSSWLSPDSKLARVCLAAGGLP